MHYYEEGIAVGRDDPRVRAHPQPGHQTWEVFLFPDTNGPYDGTPEHDGHGLGFMASEVEFL